MSEIDNSLDERANYTEIFRKLHEQNLNELNKKIGGNVNVSQGLDKPKEESYLDSLRIRLFACVLLLALFCGIYYSNNVDNEYKEEILAKVDTNNDILEAFNDLQTGGLLKDGEKLVNWYNDLD